jgi:hypothetical protein
LNYRAAKAYTARKRHRHAVGMPRFPKRFPIVHRISFAHGVVIVCSSLAR